MSRDVSRGSDSAHEQLELVRSHDRDRYITALLAPADRRSELMLLYAYDVELARIPATVREPLLAEIRLQWWRDTLAPLLTDAGRHGDELVPRPGGAPEQKSGHPLADGLLELARARALPGGLLHGLIDARSAELSDVPMNDETQLRAYLSKTDGAMLALSMQLLRRATPAIGGGGPSGHADLQALEIEACETAGRAIGLVRLARRLSMGPAARKTGGVDALVPLALWTGAERDADATTGAEAAVTISARHRVAIALLDRAMAAHAQAARAVARLPRPARRAFLPLALVPRYVTHHRRLTAIGQTPPHDLNPLVRVWTLWRARRHPTFA